MSTIAYYKNARYDGGIRTGLDIDDERAFQSFVPGGEAQKTQAWNGSWM